MENVHAALFQRVTVNEYRIDAVKWQKKHYKSSPHDSFGLILWYLYWAFWSFLELDSVCPYSLSFHRKEHEHSSKITILHSIIFRWALPVWRCSCTWTFLKPVPSVSQTLVSWSVIYIYKNWLSGRYSLSPSCLAHMGGSSRKANTGRPADLFTWWINQRGWRCWAEGVLKTQREPPTTTSQWENFSALFTHASLKGFPFTEERSHSLCCMTWNSKSHNALCFDRCYRPYLDGKCVSE